MSFPTGFAPADELTEILAPDVTNVWSIVINDKNGSPTDNLVRLDKLGLGLQLVYPTANTNFNATENAIHHVQTDTTPVTATLPASPADGTIVAFSDRVGGAGAGFATNNLTLDRNGNTIYNQASDLILSTDNEVVWLQFDDSANDWNRLVGGGGGGGGLSLPVVNESAGFNAAVNTAYHWTHTGGAGVAVMPAGPSDGDIIAFVDKGAFRSGESGFDAATLTLDFTTNGIPFQNSGGNYVLDKGTYSLWVQYNSSENEWFTLNSGYLGGIEQLAPVQNVSGSFFVTANRSYAVDTSGGVADGTLQTAPDGAIVIFFDATNDWGTNQFDIIPSFPDTVEYDGGFSNQVFNADGGVAILQYDSANTNWKFLVDSRASGGASFNASKETVNFAGVPGTIHHVDTSGGMVTATLPAGSNGDIILFADAAGSDPNAPTGFGNNTLVINPTGLETIQGFNSITLDVENEFIGLQYLAADSRWNVAFGLTSGSVLGGSGAVGDPGAVTENGETLAADKVLLESDEEYQFLDPGGSNRNVDLPTTPSYARRFIIVHDGGANSLDIRISAVVQDTITTGQQSAWVYSTSLAAWRQV